MTITEPEKTLQDRLKEAEQWEDIAAKEIAWRAKVAGRKFNPANAAIPLGAVGKSSVIMPQNGKTHRI